MFDVRRCWRTLPRDPLPLPHLLFFSSLHYISLSLPLSVFSDLYPIAPSSEHHDVNPLLRRSFSSRGHYPHPPGLPGPHPQHRQPADRQRTLVDGRDGRPNERQY